MRCSQVTIILFEMLIALTMVVCKPGIIFAVSKQEPATNDATKVGINEEELKKDAYEKKLLHRTKMDLETLERKNSKKPCNESKLKCKDGSPSSSKNAPTML